jgi:phosphotransacetylase
MSKLEKIRQWAVDKDSPIICFLNGTNPEVIKTAKALILDRIAEVIVFGDELEVFDVCRMYRLNETMLYGVVNPNDHPELDHYTELYMEENGESDRKKAMKAVKNPLTLAGMLLNEGAIDLYIEDLATF